MNVVYNLYTYYIDILIYIYNCIVFGILYVIGIKRIYNDD